MNNERQNIPGLQIKKSGNKKNPVRTILGDIGLPCWDGYYLYDESYKLMKEKVITGGRITLQIDGEITADESIIVSTEQVNAYWYLVNNQERMKLLIEEELKRNLLLEKSDEITARENESLYPKLSELTPEFNFKNFIGPASIVIGEDVKDEFAYVTWHFNCNWDVEHGFEVITYKDRIIDLGPEADIFKINEDNGTYEQVMKDHKEPATPPPFSWKKKKWWQFWK